MHKPGAAIYFPCNYSPAIDCGIASLNNCPGMAERAESNMRPAIKKVRTSKTGSALAPRTEMLPCEAAPHRRSEILEDVRLQQEIWKGCKQLKLRAAGDLSERQDNVFIWVCPHRLCAAAWLLPLPTSLTEERMFARAVYRLHAWHCCVLLT